MASRQGQLKLDGAENVPRRRRIRLCTHLLIGGPAMPQPAGSAAPTSGPLRVHPLFMDPYDGAVLGKPFDPRGDPVRRSLGHTLRYAGRVDLARAVPRAGLASTGYCLADAGQEYLVYLPEAGRVTVDLSACSDSLKVEWFNPSDGEVRAGHIAAGGGTRVFVPPFPSDSLLYLIVRHE